MAAFSGAERFQTAYIAYEAKIRTYSRAHFRSIPGYDQDELEAELLEVLWTACRKYDPDRGATFNTCFWEFAKRRIIDMKRSAFRLKRVANLNAETLEEIGVQIAVEEATVRPSAEDEALARLAVEERFRTSKKINQEIFHHFRDYDV